MYIEKVEKEEEAESRDNVTVEIVDLQVIARAFNVPVKFAEYMVQHGLDPSTIPGACTQQSSHNLITTNGINLLLKRLGSDAESRITHCAIGTNNTAPAVGQTALFAEIFRDYVTQWVYVSNGVYNAKFYLSSQNCNGQTIREAGIFNAASNGTMFARVLFSPEIAKTVSIGVTLTWQVTIT